MPKIYMHYNPTASEESMIPSILLVDLGFSPQGRGIISEVLPEHWTFRKEPEPIKLDPLLFVNEEQTYLDAECYFKKILNKEEEPIRVILLENGRYCVEDGWHRLAAAIYRNEESIMAYVAIPRKEL